MPTISEDDIRQFVTTTISEEMSVPIDASITDASPLGLGGIDLESLQLIELVGRLQTRYAIEIPDADIEPLSAMTLGDVLAYVRKKAE